MKILVACEYSQIVTEAFIMKGHDVMSCDNKYDGEKGYNHYKGDVMDIINNGWDMMIGFPPCTYLAKAQIFRLSKEEGRLEKSDKAVKFVKDLYFSNIPKVIIENPQGRLSTAWRPFDQQISPHLFGSEYKKDICLWIKGVRPLKVDRTNVYEGDFKKVRNHVNGRMDKELRSKIKSRFFYEVADAMADQWG